MGGAVGVGKALRGYGAVSRKKGGKIYCCIKDGSISLKMS